MQHLKTAASLGDRAAALECAEVLGGRAPYEIADQMDGPVDDPTHGRGCPRRRAANEVAPRRRCRGATDALAVPTRRGDAAALAQLAARGDIDAIRTLATEAVDLGNA